MAKVLPMPQDPIKKFRVDLQAVTVVEVTSPDEKEATGFAVGFLKARNPDFRVIRSKVEEIKDGKQKKEK